MDILEIIKMILIPLSYLVSNCIYDLSPRLKKEQKKHKIEKIVINIFQDVLDDIIDEPKTDILETPEHQEMIEKIQEKIEKLRPEDIHKYYFDLDGIDEKEVE